MAGSLAYRLRVDHIYQRRFDQAGLAEALTASHWYIISRRPTVRITAGSAADGILTIDVSSHDPRSNRPCAWTMGADLSHLGSLSSFTVLDSGRYFSVVTDDGLIHGDAWTLASLLSNAQTDIARQEVLYAGQAFGTEGSSTALQRLRNHETLQRIYEDHSGSNFDIFVSPMSLERGSWSSDDHIDDAEDGPDLEAYHRVIAESDGRLRKTAVDLVEHGLISYFAPSYNTNLVRWQFSEPTKAMRKMQSIGFRLLTVHLNGWCGLARYWTELVPDAPRSHFASHDLPPAPRRPVLRGIGSAELSSWRIGATMVQEGQELFATAAERSGVAMRVFGDEAPPLRVPSGITIPSAVPTTRSTTGAARPSIVIRKALKDEQERLIRATEPLRHPGTLSYDASTGLIVIGTDADGAPTYWPLHHPDTGRMSSGLILGDRGLGRPNALRLILVEALASQEFAVALIDVESKGEFAALVNALPDDLTAAGVTSGLRLLERLAEELRVRLAARTGSGTGASTPALVVGIDDADHLLGHSHGARLVSELLADGPSVGIGLVMVASDISRFAADAKLMQLLVSVDRQFIFGSPTMVQQLEVLDAIHGGRRLRSWSERAFTFVLRYRPGDSTVGSVTAWADASLPTTDVHAWAHGILEEANRPLTLPWRPIDDAQAWEAIDTHGARWHLHRHEDSWILTLVMANFRAADHADALQWAKDAIAHRLEVDIEPWQSGPGTACPGELVLYADATGDLQRRDQSEDLKRMMAERFY